ncbi:MAG: hypothetical protein OK455_02380 [Thaumarchaeota archaeon]|nr:hypothetical protein [Nitrososphaerota archaeon]
MDEQDVQKQPEAPEQREEYKYTAEVRAWETFSNVMRRHGVTLPEGDRTVTFTSKNLIDMKRMKEMRLIWSYSITKVVRTSQLIEQG